MSSTFTLIPAISGQPFSISDFNTDISLIQAAIRALQDATSSNGTVTSFSKVDTSVAPIFSTSVATATTTPQLTFTIATQSGNKFIASPADGSSGSLLARTIVIADIPTITVAKGGTNLTAVGTAYQILRTNSAATALEYATLTAGSTKLTITPSAGAFTIDIAPAFIDIATVGNDASLSGHSLPIVRGGSGATTQQGAIDALTNASGGTATYVLTTDGTHATWQAPTAGTVTSVSGTANRITVSNGTTTPGLDISASYVGQSSITTLGTIGTGVWNGTVVGATYGGTGINNGSYTITLGGNLITTNTGAATGTLAFSGAYTLTIPATGTAALLGTAQAFTAAQTFSSDLIVGAALKSTTEASTGGAGTTALSLTTLVSKITTTGAQAFSLANGTDGQVKIINMVVNGGNATITPTPCTGFTTITLSAIGKGCILSYNTTQGWIVIGNNGATLA